MHTSNIFNVGLAFITKPHHLHYFGGQKDVARGMVYPKIIFLRPTN